MDSIGWVVAALPPVHAAVVTLPLIRSDLRERRLPNRLVLPLLATSLICSVLAAALMSDWLRLGWAFVCSLSVFLLGLGMALGGRLGMGDVKLGTALAHALGFLNPLLPWVGLALAFLLASGEVVVSWVRRLRRRSRPLNPIAFGPYLLAGFLLSTFAVFGRELPAVELLGWASHGQHIEQYVELL